ncbi:uncharacterized protein [Lepeophtheirus salmonis]|uniref:uncharacterized protein n=1 Tax=Lepeophtheirus salmonis TaxID=72036 RepID=UPI001AE276CC|nr:lamin-L(III)-like [Lepeophtheirus salmonis]
MNDEFSTYFKNINWRKEVEPLEVLAGGKVVLNIPQCKEVQRINREKNVTTAEKALNETNQQYKKKVENLKKRIRQVKHDQDNLKNNLVKFNNFVREKQSKVSFENAKKEEELSEQRFLEQQFEETKENIILLKDQKENIKDLVSVKKGFKEYLQKFVEHEISRNRYKDIDEMMKRCETLITTREDLLKSLNSIKDQIKEKANRLDNLKKEHEEQIIQLKKEQGDLNIKYNEKRNKKRSSKLFRKSVSTRRFRGVS